MSIITEKSSLKTVDPKDACGEECMIFSRVCGYYRPINNWNHGKKEEFKDRLTFRVKPVCNCCERKNG